MFCHKEVQDPMPFVGTEPGNLYDFRITTCGESLAIPPMKREEPASNTKTNSVSKSLGLGFARFTPKASLQAREAARENENDRNAST